MAVFVTTATCPQRVIGFPDAKGTHISGGHLFVLRDQPDPDTAPDVAGVFATGTWLHATDKAATSAPDFDARQALLAIALHAGLDGADANTAVDSFLERLNDTLAEDFGQALITKTFGSDGLRMAEILATAAPAEDADTDDDDPLAA